MAERRQKSYSPETVLGGFWARLEKLSEWGATNVWPLKHEFDADLLDPLLSEDTPGNATRERVIQRLEGMAFAQLVVPAIQPWHEEYYLTFFGARGTVGPPKLRLDLVMAGIVSYTALSMQIVGSAGATDRTWRQGELVDGVRIDLASEDPVYPEHPLFPPLAVVDAIQDVLTLPREPRGSA